MGSSWISPHSRQHRLGRTLGIVRLEPLHAYRFAEANSAVALILCMLSGSDVIQLQAGAVLQCKDLHMWC